jgi:hypothetical protein
MLSIVHIHYSPFGGKKNQPMMLLVAPPSPPNFIKNQMKEEENT